MPLVTLLAMLAGCRDVTAPGAPARIVVHAGAGATDTIGAELAPLRLTVTDASGRPVPGVEVVVDRVVMPPSDPDWRPEDRPVAIPRTMDGRAAEYGGLHDTTDADGATAIRVTLGWVAGTAALALSVPSVGVVDTVRFTVRPGAPKHLELLSAYDTALTVGARARMAAIRLDRAFNRRDDSVTFASSAPELAVAANGDVRALAVGRAALTVSAPGIDSVTTWISVVPAGTLAVVRQDLDGTALGVMHVDGTGFRRVPFDGVPGLPEVTWEGFGPRWSADGQTLLVNAQDEVYRVSLDGGRYPLASSLPGDPADPERRQPVRHLARESKDGWIYQSVSCTGGEIVYRVRPGSATPAERVSPEPYDGDEELARLLNCQAVRHEAPTLSPDGRHLAFTDVAFTPWRSTLSILDVASRSIRSLAIDGYAARWSPTGDLIAYWSDGGLWVVRPDGTGRRRISTSSRDYRWGVTWSPDGAYLLARRGDPFGATLVLIAVSSGREIPLPYSYWRRPQNGHVISYGQPDWRHD
ncbi:hypothetical protein [Roseisolibacter agri]|uniref:Protein TolB n=1 Tax=Roseisolibacter agri TaxID=2014610 RepID=A0AA37QD84_9BACT|nr:hypothetical protein [Roseisolibacter agri]GLC23603.1 hypothetical protein rosag_01160 [Roseisolibacter agri]